MTGEIRRTIGTAFETDTAMPLRAMKARAIKGLASQEAQS